MKRLNFFFEISIFWLVFAPLGALAQTQAPPMPGEPPPPTFTGVLFEMMPMFMLVFLVFYLMVLKPQQTKLRLQQELVNGLKKGDTVTTSGGLIGRVAGIEKDHILLEVSPNVKIKVEASHVAKKAESSAGQTVAAA